MSDAVDLYNNVYADFGGAVESAVRQAAFGQDIGQSSWLTAHDWLGFADRAHVSADSHVLEVGSGSGGPAVFLATQRGCRVTGVDLNEHGARNGNLLASAQGVTDRASFHRLDAGLPLPFPDGTFDAVLSNDAMCHIENRLDVLREWHRLLRPFGRVLFTDPLVITGPIAQADLATRCSVGTYLVVPPGVNEQLIARAGFRLLAVEDVTDAEVTIAQRWRAAREAQREPLEAREGEANFAGLQRFLACVHRLAGERRLSRFCYLAEKPT